MDSYPQVTRLPMELIYQVCKLIDSGDLAAVRFISPEFAAVGLTYLMSTMSFVLAPTSIQRLEHVKASCLVQACENCSIRMRRLP